MQDSGNSKVVHLIGDAISTFQLSEAVEFNKGSKLRLDFQRQYNQNFDVGSVEDSLVEICIHEERNGDLFRLEHAPDESRCASISVDGTSTIFFGREQFLNKKVLVRFITFKQVVNSVEPSRAVEVVFSKLIILLGSLSDQVLNGKCTDFNAMSEPEDGKCVCNFGFVSSNGGWILNEQADACVPVTDSMGYDGDACNINRDCLRGVCQSNTCLAEVSWFLTISSIFLC